MTDPVISSGSDWLRHVMPHFLEQTKNRLTEIKAQQQAIHDGSDAFAAMKAISDVAHKISGTADTFGFHDLGAFAQNIEAVWSTRSQGGKDTMVMWSSMERAMTPLIHEITTLLEPK